MNSGGNRLGALCLLFAHTHPLDESEQAQVAWYAEQAAQAFDRTTAFEREHEVAVRLQRSLLSNHLPDIEGVELIGRYNAGGAGLLIGGDWYDAIRRSDGIVHVTVGDVAGHGVTAAVLMGQLRNAFRAHAYEHTSPADVLRRMLRHVDEDEMATALCLTLDPYTQELTYASAGHPPSLLVNGDSAVVERLGHALAPPLGYVDPSEIREAMVELPAGGTLVAYTDGLVEKRGWSIDTGIDLLASVVGASSSLGADPLADRIFAEVAPHIGSSDDIGAPDRPPARGARSAWTSRCHATRRRSPICAGVCASGSSCAGWPRTSATTPSSPSARPATTRSSTPTARSPARSICSSSIATARSRSASRTAAHGTRPRPASSAAAAFR